MTVEPHKNGDWKVVHRVQEYIDASTKGGPLLLKGQVKETIIYTGRLMECIRIIEELNADPKP